jgi:hypothetical protein
MIDHAESVRNFYRKQGAATEQQRIIELLEQIQKPTVHIVDPSIFKPKQIKIICDSLRADFVIALIKGDN